MKVFKKSDPTTIGFVSLRSDDEVLVTLKSGVVEKTTPSEFDTIWEPVQILPYHYFITFAAGTWLGNTTFARSAPITSPAEILAIEDSIATTLSTPEDKPKVSIQNFRLYDEPIGAYELTAEILPTLEQLLTELKTIPAWETFVSMDNVNRISELVEKFNPTRIQFPPKETVVN